MHCVELVLLMNGKKVGLCDPVDVLISASIAGILVSSHLDFDLVGFFFSCSWLNCLSVAYQRFRLCILGNLVNLGVGRCLCCLICACMYSLVV